VREQLLLAAGRAETNFAIVGADHDRHPGLAAGREHRLRCFDDEPPVANRSRHAEHGLSAHEPREDLGCRRPFDETLSRKRP
jgi:hypothetical protein